MADNANVVTSPDLSYPLLPWHDPLWQQVLQRWQQDHLPHALLLVGNAGLGKRAFALRLAHLLLCLQPDNATPCGQCKTCHLWQAGTHPDIRLVQPDKHNGPITVDQIRALTRYCALTAHYQRWQIVLLAPAESMNRNAFNSLLKLLEEPPDNTLLLLISHQPSRLAATIRSRCQRLDFQHCDTHIMQQWLTKQLPADQDSRLLLALSGQAPLAAVSLAESGGLAVREALFDSLRQLLEKRADPMSIAAVWADQDHDRLLRWMQSWTQDLLRYALSEQTDYLINQDQAITLARLSHRCPPPQLFALLEQQQMAWRLLQGTTNVKPLGLMESLAIDWLKAGITRRS